MGNSSCQVQVKKSMNDIAVKYKMQFIHQIKDPYLGEIQLFKSGDQYFLFLEKKFNSQSEYQQYLEQCEEQDFLNHNENLLKLHGYIPQKVEDFCSKYFQITLIYEFFYDNLLNEYNKKKHQQIKFDENEIWCIINSVCEVLKEIKQEHGELCLENIMIDRTGNIKIYNNHFINKNSNGISRYERSRIFKQKYLQNNSEQIFMDQLQFKSYDPDSTQSYFQLMGSNYNTFQKRDIFSLGLICLQLLRMEKITEVYDFDNFQINQHLIEQYIWEVEKDGFYSEGLIDLVKRMTMVDEQDRPDINQIIYYCSKVGITNNKRINIFDMSQSKLIHQSQMLHQSQMIQYQNQSKICAGISCINANLSRIEEAYEDKDQFITDSFLNMQEGNKNLPFHPSKKNSFLDCSKNFDITPLKERKTSFNNRKNSLNDKKNSFFDNQEQKPQSCDQYIDSFNMKHKEMEQKINEQQMEFEKELQKLDQQRQMKQQELTVIQKQGQYIEEQSILQQKDITNSINYRQNECSMRQNDKNFNYIDPKVQLVIQQMRNQQYNTQGQTVMEQINLHTINEISEYQTVKDDKYLERENNPYYDQQLKTKQEQKNSEMWKYKAADKNYQHDLQNRLDESKLNNENLQQIQQKRMQLFQQYKNKRP